MGAKMNSINGTLVFDDTTYAQRIYNAFGNGVRKFLMEGPTPADDTTNTPTGFIATAVGTSPVTVGEVAGYPLLITTGASEYDGDNLQARGESFKLESGKPVYFGAAIKLSEATEIDLLVGLCELKTDLLKTSVAHGVLATNVEGVFFHKVDAVTTITAKAYLDGAQTFTGNVGTMTTSEIIYEIYWDGTTLKFYLDGILVTQIASSLPDGDLTPSINVRAGSAAARTASIAWLRSIQLR